MTERMERRLLDLKARQQAEEHMLCPRCGADTMKEPVCTNALSRVADLYVCDSCGTAEAMLAFMKQDYPLTSWAAFQPVRPPSDLEALPAAEVLQRVMKEQADTLTEPSLSTVQCRPSGIGTRQSSRWRPRYCAVVPKYAAMALAVRSRPIPVVSISMPKVWFFIGCAPFAVSRFVFRRGFSPAPPGVTHSSLCAAEKATRPKRQGFGRKTALI